MSIFKRAKDQLIRLLLGPGSVPEGVVEVVRYFRDYEPIKFTFEKTADGIVARSVNFRYGTIITSGKDQHELDANIKDAILTSFEIPSSFSKEVPIAKVGDNAGEYAAA